MKRSFGMLVAIAGFSVLVSTARGDEKDATPIIDAAIKALGGEEKLTKAMNFSSKSKGTVSINENELPITVSATMQGLNLYRSDFEIEFNGQAVKGQVILNGKKGWQTFSDNVMDLDAERLEAAKQNAYLMAIPWTLLPLKGKDFKVEAAPEEKVNGKPADVLKGTGPDGKPFTLYFDKETHLPARIVAKVMGMQGEELLQETSFNDFKDFDGTKHASKFETKRDGNAFSKQELLEYKIVEKPDPSLFEEPK
jgi:hypothetical protein